MAAARVRPRDTVGGLLSPIGSRALLVCAAAGLVPFLLMDRGLFSAAPVAWPDASGADWPMPCRNTTRAVAAPPGHAAGIRPRASGFWTAGRYGRPVRHTMTIERRKKVQEGEAPGARRGARCVCRQRAPHAGQQGAQEAMGHRDGVQDGEARHDEGALKVRGCQGPLPCAVACGAQRVGHGVRRGSARAQGRLAAAGKVPPGACLRGRGRAGGEAGTEASPGAAAARSALDMCASPPAPSPRSFSSSLWSWRAAPPSRARRGCASGARAPPFPRQTCAAPPRRGASLGTARASAPRAARGAPARRS